VPGNPQIVGGPDLDQVTRMDLINLLKPLRAAQIRALVEVLGDRIRVDRERVLVDCRETAQVIDVTRYVDTLVEMDGKWDLCAHDPHDLRDYVRVAGDYPIEMEFRRVEGRLDLEAN
jgi:hypothetical protein